MCHPPQKMEPFDAATWVVASSTSVLMLVVVELSTDAKVWL